MLGCELNWSTLHPTICPAMIKRWISWCQTQLKGLPKVTKVVYCCWKCQSSQTLPMSLCLMRSLRGPFRGFGFPLGLLFCRKVPFFSILGERTRKIVFSLIRFSFWKISTSKLCSIFWSPFCLKLGSLFNTTLHPNHPLKICGIWPTSVVFDSNTTS